MCRLFFVPPLAAGLLALFVVPAFPAAPEPAPPEWLPGTRMVESVQTTLVSARTFTEGSSGYGFDTNVSVLAGFAQPGEELNFNRPLDKNELYTILAGADTNAADIDLKVTDVSGNEIARDEENDAAPTIRFKAPKSATYKVAVSLEKVRDKTRGAFVTLFFLRRGGLKLPSEDVTAALTTLIDGCAEVSRAVRKKVLFQGGNNQWALYGAILEPSESQTVTGLRFGIGERMVLAAGDRDSEDVDVAVMNDENEVLLRDRTKEPFGFVKFAEDENKPRGLQFTNVRSRRGKAALVFATVLRLE